MSSEDRQIVCIASTMRSGSTLLKALVAEAEDVSNLPEQNFQKYKTASTASNEILALDDHRIVVLKRPGWYNEIGGYPRLPAVDGLKTLVLIRDVYDTVESLRKMTFRKLQGLVGWMVDGWLAKKYWLGMTQSLVRLHEDQQHKTFLVHYEKLTANPIEVTKSLFEFLGSARREGTDTYSPPGDFHWKWGTDDNSENIKTLKVQSKPPKPRTNQRLVRLIESHPGIKKIRQKLEYE